MTPEEELAKLKAENEQLRAQLKLVQELYIELNMAVNTLGNHAERMWKMNVNVQPIQAVMPDG